MGIFTQGSVMEFEQYVRQRQVALWRFAVVLCEDPVLAEDVVTDVLGHAYERWHRIGRVENPHAYVRRMIVNEYLSWRRRRRPAVSLATLEDFAPVAGAVEDPSVQHAERHALLADLAALPRQQRAALVLHYYEGLSTQEIADVLGCSAVTVRSNTSRALAALRVAMGVTPALTKES